MGKSGRPSRAGGVVPVTGTVSKLGARLYSSNLLGFIVDPQVRG
jgi:hypothetical protein